jgi:hypothetical protein
MGELLHHAAARARAIGKCDESWSPLVIAYLHLPSRSGLVAIVPRDGDPHWAGWFSIHER